MTGTFVVRHNRFVASTTANEAGVSGRSIDALVDASVALTVESNVFEDRTIGAEARTSYDTGTRSVAITVRNNVFFRVENPFRASESGTVGVIDATLEHNTFYDFGTAIALFGMSRTTHTRSNLFVEGTKAVDGSPYDVAHSMTWNVTTPAASPPLSGTFATGDPSFVNVDAGDLRLGAGSLAVDRVPASGPLPAEDYQGCPRPASATGAAPKADIGAYESQP